MVLGTEKLIKKLAKGYERRSVANAYYIASSNMANFLAELISEFSGICIGIRKDRGQGLSLSVMSSGTRAMLYSVYVRNSTARGVDHAKVKYSFTIENRDVILDFN